MQSWKSTTRASFSLKSVVEAGEGFGQYKREKGGKSNRSTSKAKGFSKPWDKVEPLIPIITGDMPCACNSGKIYQECCELHHTNSLNVYVASSSEETSGTPTELAACSPEGILRARYTGTRQLAFMVCYITHDIRTTTAILDILIVRFPRFFALRFYLTFLRTRHQLF